MNEDGGSFINFSIFLCFSSILFFSFALEYFQLFLYQFLICQRDSNNIKFVSAMILLSGLSLVFNKNAILLLNIFFKLIGNKFPHFRRSTTPCPLFCTLNIFLFTFLSQLEFSQFFNGFRNDLSVV